MTLGTGIFMSTLVVSLVVLYGMTKERWNWKKSITRIFFALVIFGGLIAGGYWGFDAYQNRAVVQTEFAGIKLSHTKSDVVFIKGSPVYEKENTWTYRGGYDEKLELLVMFRENNIEIITYFGDSPYRYKIGGLGIGDSYEKVIDKFGSPSSVSISEDQLQRMLSFEKYNVFFQFRENRVTMFGIYNKEYGDMKNFRRIKVK
jgi:hypothetical protein